MWPWGVLGVLYGVVGVVSTNFYWNEDIDEFYGALTANWRYVFFAAMILFWPIWMGFFYQKELRRKKVREDD